MENVLDQKITIRTLVDNVAAGRIPDWLRGALCSALPNWPAVKRTLPHVIPPIETRIETEVKTVVVKEREAACVSDLHGQVATVAYRGVDLGRATILFSNGKLILDGHLTHTYVEFDRSQFEARRDKFKELIAEAFTRDVLLSARELMAEWTGCSKGQVAHDLGMLALDGWIVGEEKWAGKMDRPVVPTQLLRDWWLEKVTAPMAVAA